jgi:pimeloyl-ACP methyl ester carboxylesterase
MSDVHAADTRADIAHLRLAAEIAGLDAPEIVLPRARDSHGAGLRLRHLDWGSSGRPPVLFLHGGLLTAHTWDLVCLSLRAGYHCRALDFRGHGESGWSPDRDYRLAAHVADLELLADELGLQRFVLVGQSLGALTALAYAREHGDRVAGLALVDIGETYERAGARRLEGFTQLPRELDDIGDFVARASAFNPARDPRLLRRSLLHNLRRLPDGRWTWKYDPALLEGAFLRIRGEFSRTIAGAPAVACPALVIRGVRSDMTTLAAAWGLASAFPRGELVEVDAGHTVQGDNPRELVAEIVPWLGRVWSETPPLAIG